MVTSDNMQSWAYLLAPTFQFINSAGKPLTEGWLEVYIAGTRNKYYCASDFNGTLHPFQIPLDSLGANIVLADPDQAYDVYVYNKYGSLIMSRYHVSPGIAGGSGVLSISIGSEDGTVSVTNDGNGNFDLSIQDTVDRIDALEQAVSGLSADSSVGYAIAHAYTVELDGTFDLVSDAVTGIGYTPNMDGFRLKSGHVYQFNFNALFENGAFDRNCSGKLYLEGPNTIAQEWKFDLDDSYYHSQSINGSTVLVTPKDLNYYDVKLKLAWDVDYPNKPNVDLNKISIVDITTLLMSNSASGTGGDYTGGDGIFINDETNVISVDMDYINSHLDFDASSIIASAVNIATAYTDARVTSVSGDLVNLIAEVSASIPTGTVTQVQSDWTEQDSSSPAYIQHKPDLTVYATNASLTAVSSVLQNEIEAISGAIPTDYVTHNEVSAVSGNIIEYVNSVSGDLVETINNVSGDIIHTVETVSGDIIETITTVSGDIIETVNNVSGDIIHTVESVSGDLVEIIETATANIPEQVNADWNAVSGKAEILNKPDLSIYATHDELVDAVTAVSSMIPTDYVTHSEVSAVSANLVNYVNSVSGDITNYVDESIVSAINVATGACEQVQSDWTEDDTNDPAYIQNKPNEIEIVAGQNIGIFSDATTITIAASAASGTNYQAGYGIDITGDTISVDASIIPSTSAYATHTEVNNVSAAIIAQIPEQQVNSDWTATSGVAEILNKPNESELIAGAGVSITASGSNYIISAVVTGSPVISGYVTEAELETVSGNIVNQIPDVSNLATKTELATVSASIPDVSGFATVELVSAVSGKLPTTEVGKFTIQNNVSGGPIEVICPTDQAPDAVFYQINSVSGYAYATAPSYGVVTYYYGETPADFNGSDDVILFTINDNIANIVQINFYYSQSETIFGGPSLSTTYINGGSTYTLQSGTYRVKAQYNPAPGYGYGKYLQIIFSWHNYATDATQSLQWVQDALSKITFFGVTRPDPTLGSIVNLDRYYLGNTSTITNTSSYTQAVIYTDPTSKKQSVYLPLTMPYNWTANSNFVQSFLYGDSSGRPSTSDFYTKQYRAYKYTSSPTRYQFAYCTDWDYANNIMTFVAYDDSGNAIEKWTLDYTINGSNVWTTTPISSGGTEYTAGDYIGITDDTISVTGITDLVAGDNITITASGSSAIISSNGSGDVTIEELASVSGTLETEIQVVSSAIPDISSLASKSEVNAVSGTLQTEIVAISGAMVDVPTGVSGVVAGEGIAITASGSDYVISCTVTGGSSYSAGTGIDITNDVISIDNTVALKNEIPDTTDMATQTWVGNQGYLTSIPSTYVTDTELNGAVSGLATKSEVQTVSAAIPSIDNLATKTEVSIVEANVQIVSSAIPDVSNLATKTDVATVSAAIPDTSTLATKTEVTNGLGTKQNTLTGITDIQVVQSLPVSPVSTVLYLIPEA